MKSRREIWKINDVSSGVRYAIVELVESGEPYDYTTVKIGSFEELTEDEFKCECLVRGLDLSKSDGLTGDPYFDMIAAGLRVSCGVEGH